MKIISYQYQDVSDTGWIFEKVEFSKINLLVGDTATGKTRLLNTIFNLGRFVASDSFYNGWWNIQFDHAGTRYDWEIKTQKTKLEYSVEKAPGIIIKEKLVAHTDQKESILIERDENSFIYNNKEIPKLPLEKTSITLLKEEPDISPLQEAFSIIMRRRFFHDALSGISELSAIPILLMERLEKNRRLRILFNAEMNLSINLYLLSKYFPTLYDSIFKYYKGFFPFVQEMRIRDLSKIQPRVAIAGLIPVFEIREKGSKNWVPITELSSGMQKVLLILTDLYLLPEEGVYMIDEYENSLGINAIDFFPEFINEFDKPVQLLITSHHPYLINAIPPENWLIFHRKGMDVQIKYGKQLADRFTKSKQQAFFQLINDPFYSAGIE